MSQGPGLPQHGIGLTRQTWDPAVPALARHFDVIAVDLPGFGGSASLPAETEPLAAALAATAGRRFLATVPIDVPVTIAFGGRDVLLLRRQSRHLGQLPPGTRAEPLPGCGHVPMADDPAAVAALIGRTAARAHPPEPVPRKAADNV
jgi:pimeloyl-ACP methyl ester carboxylesterase